MKYQIGKSYKVAMYDIEIIDSFKDYLIGNSRVEGTYYIIRIVQNGLITVIQERNLDTHDIIRYVPTLIGGKACKGNIDINQYRKTYSIWRDMMDRCLNMNDKLFPLYGALGVTVHPKWLCFEYFQDDIPRIDGSTRCINDKSKTSYVIDFTPRTMNNIPLYQRQYNRDTCYITKFNGSNIMYDNQFVKSQGGGNTSSKHKNNNGPYGFLSGSGEPVNPQPAMYVQEHQPTSVQQADEKPKYTEEDYQRVIDDPSFMKQYPELKEPHMLEPNTGRITGPATEPREPGTKVMCVLLPENRAKLYGRKK